MEQQGKTPTPLSHVRVKRKLDTFFVAINLSATTADLLQKTAYMMRVKEEDVRIGRVDKEGRVSFLSEEDVLHKVGVVNDEVLCAVLRVKTKGTEDGGGWEEPCVVEFPGK